MQSIAMVNRTWTALMRLYARVERAGLGLISAGIAFFGFLAVFPAVAAVIAIWGFAADPVAIRNELAIAQDFLPPDAFSLLSSQVEALLAANSRDLGWATIISLVIALWSARAGVAALIQGLNAIHHVPSRAGLGEMIRALLLTMALVGVTLVAMILSIVFPVVIAFLPLGRATALVLEAVNLGLGLLIVVFGVALVYRLGPNRKIRSTALFTRGLVVAVLLWAVASRGLVIYFANFASYNEVYGSIGAVVALLMWLYISAYAVLLGAAIDADRAARQ